MIKKSLLLFIIPFIVIAAPLFSDTFLAPNGNMLSPTYGTSQTVGYQFTANNNLILTALGVWSGNTSTLNAQVGIWDSSGNLLRQVSIPLSYGGTVISGYRYVNFANSLSLVAGQTYYMGARINGSQFYPTPLPTNLNTQFTVDPAITIVKGGYRGNSFGVPNLFETTGFPLSASAIFTVLATPEPETYLILGSLLGVMAFITAKKRKISSIAK